MPLISASNLQFQELRFQFQVATGWWRWTTSANLSGSSPTYAVKDIIAPTGLLRDSVPIPGDVVQAMSASIDQLQQNFTPSILFGPPSSLSFVVDEGRGFSTPQGLAITNNGVYGSLLDVEVTTSAAYVAASPANIGNLASNESGTVQVSVDSTDLLATGSPYSQALTATDASASNSPRTFPITITVRPKATISCSSTTINFSAVRPISGPFPSVLPQTFDLQNTGSSGSVLAYQIAKLTGISNWLVSFAPPSGSLAASATQVVTINVAPPEGMLAGVYTETLRVSGYSTNTFVDVLVQLTIT